MTREPPIAASGVCWRFVMVKPRKVTDARDARACLAAAKAAGLSNREWAREWGVDGRSLNAWRINLSRGASAMRTARTKKTTDLVELVPVASPTKASRYVVHLGEISVEFGADFEEPA